MKTIGSFVKLAASMTLFVGAFAGAAFAQGVTLPHDHLPAVQIAVALGTEVKNLCRERFPEIAAEVEKKFNSWPLSHVNIQILVNGKEYISPFIQVVTAQVREEFNRDDAEKSKTTCEEIDKVLDSFTKGAPPGALDPFLPSSNKTAQPDEKAL